MREIKIQISPRLFTAHLYDLTIERSGEEDVNEILTAEGIKRVILSVVTETLQQIEEERQ